MNGNIMYGLFKYTYPEYEEEQFIAVSENKELLVKKYESIDIDHSVVPLIILDDSKGYNEYREFEQSHYTIEPVEYLV